MKQFYESELTDISIHEENKVNEHSNRKKGMNLAAEKRRREMKKDPQEKVKDKLWESIIKEAENDDGDDSSDDEHEI